MGKVLCIALSIICFSAYSQEIRKEGGKTVIVLDEETAKVCEKFGCVLLPMPVVEQIVIDTAKMMCGKEV